MRTKTKKTISEEISFERLTVVKRKFQLKLYMNSKKVIYEHSSRRLALCIQVIHNESIDSDASSLSNFTVNNNDDEEKENELHIIEKHHKVFSIKNVAQFLNLKLFMVYRLSFTSSNHMFIAIKIFSIHFFQ